MHDLPLWFLVVSLFLPRLGLFILWYHDWMFPVPQPGSGLLWFFIPRVLIIIMVYGAFGMTGWFWLHTIVAVLTYLCGYARSQDNG